MANETRNPATLAGSSGAAENVTAQSIPEARKDDSITTTINAEQKILLEDASTKMKPYVVKKSCKDVGEVSSAADTGSPEQLDIWTNARRNFVNKYQQSAYEDYEQLTRDVQERCKQMLESQGSKPILCQEPSS
jgi:hypothetical protein